MNNAWTVDRTKKQWIDLGIHTDACMTQPDTCDATGGAISVWVKVIECNEYDGIISSLTGSPNKSTGSAIDCWNGYIGYDIFAFANAFT